MEAAGIALLWWCAHVALGRLAGIIVAVILLSMSDMLRFFLLFPAGRVDLTIHAAVFCAALILIGGRPGRPRPSSQFTLWLGLVTVALGALAATDSLTLATVVGPYSAPAPLICWLHERSSDARRVAVFAVVTGVLSGLIGGLLGVRHRRLRTSPIHRSPVVFTTASHLGASFANLLAAWVSLAGGPFFGVPVAGANLFLAVADLLSLAALAAVCVALYKRTRAALRTPLPPVVVNPLRDLYVTYFALFSP